jgi:hypothetical protein
MGDDKHCSLESVIATEQLALREFRVPDCKRETQAITELIDHLAKSPQDFF